MPINFTKSRPYEGRLHQLRPDGQPRPGDIILFTHANRIKRLVSWFTVSRYYHVGIYEGNSHVIEARVNGVVRRDISVRGYAIRIIPMPEDRAEPVLAYTQSCIGKHYDVLGVMFMIIREHFPRTRIRYHSKDMLTCGEFVTRAWIHGGINLFPGLDPEGIYPGDFQAYLPVDSHDTMLWKNYDGRAV